MGDMQMYGVLVVPIIMGIVQLIKNAGLNPRYLGLVAWVLGVLVGLGFGLSEAQWSILQSLIVGSALGLSASGLYSTQKNVRQTIR